MRNPQVKHCTRHGCDLIRKTYCHKCEFEYSELLGDAVKALAKQLKRSCGCYSNTEEDWHSKDCATPEMRDVLTRATALGVGGKK